MDKYTVLRTDTADSLIHKIILDIAERITLYTDFIEQIKHFSTPFLRCKITLIV